MPDYLDRLTDEQTSPTNLNVNGNREEAGGRARVATTDLLAGDDHAVDLGDGRVGRHARLVVHVAVAFAVSGVIGGHFA